jgi:hypothetical protein
MNGPERRQTSRTTLARHAYINIEPNNGGIVLNVSDGGICFYSFDPVPRNGTIRFWFSDHNPRIEAEGTPAWSDETQKTGLRFTALPVEAREKIRDWMGHPTIPVPADEGASDPQPSARSLTGRWGGTQVALASAPRVVSPELEMPRLVSGFSRGLATGVLVSAMVVAVFSFNNYRREFGQSLIRLGEQFTEKPRVQTLTVSAASPAVLPTGQPLLSPPRTLSPAPEMTAPVTRATSPVPPKVLPVPAASPVPRPEKVLPQPTKLVSQPLAEPAKSQAKVEPTTLITATGASDVVTKAPATAALAIPPMPPATSLPITAPMTVPITQPAADAGGPSLLGRLGATGKVEPENQPSVHTESSGTANADSTRELYFEVGRFKNVFQAHDEADKLAQLGFSATAVAKGHLWTSSFHVLVGPYPDEEQAKAIHENLVSSGFKPRPFEKGARTFTILSSLTLNGGRAPEGDYTISWESYIGDANVKFTRRDSVVATADGKWVKRDVKYPRDAYVYRKNADGSRTLLEIHFGGMRQALVFGKAM